MWEQSCICDLEIPIGNTILMYTGVTIMDFG